MRGQEGGELREEGRGRRFLLFFLLLFVFF